MAAEPGAVAAVTSADALSAIVLCGLMGVLGQGVRAVIGLKNAGSLSSTTPSNQTGFSVAYFTLSLMIGFIAGVLSGITVGLVNFTSIDLNNIKPLLGVAAAGYVGADFIENTMSLVIPAAAPAPAVVEKKIEPVTTAAAIAVSQPASPLTTPPKADDVALRNAMKIVCPKVNTGIWVPYLVDAFEKYGIGTDKKKAVAIGQFLVEAGPAFQEIIEKLGYSAERASEIFSHIFPTPADAAPYVGPGKQEAFGNHVYANRNGNGDEASGDGYRFRGRGLIQLTGRTEYTDFGNTIGKTAEEAAQYCETTEGAAFSGAWYLSSRDCLPFAEKWDVNEVTLRVNGKKMVGAAQRLEYANDMLKHLGSVQVA